MSRHLSGTEQEGKAGHISQSWAVVGETSRPYLSEGVSNAEPECGIAHGYQEMHRILGRGSVFGVCSFQFDARGMLAL